jgi:hypothetical protein
MPAGRRQAGEDARPTDTLSVRNYSRGTSLNYARDFAGWKFSAEPGNRFDATGPAPALRYRLISAQVFFGSAAFRFPAAPFVPTQTQCAPPVEDRGGFRRRTGRLGTVAVPVRSAHRPDGRVGSVACSFDRGAVWDEAGGVTGGTGRMISGG